MTVDYCGCIGGPYLSEWFMLACNILTVILLLITLYLGKKEERLKCKLNQTEKR